MTDRISQYVVSHWQGKQSFAWSFWVNFVFLRLLIFLAQEFLAPDKGEDYHDFKALIIALDILVHGLVFIWQIVGVFRSGENWQIARGSQANVWGSQIAIALSLWFTAIYALQAWQMTAKISKEENHLVKMDREHASKYDFILSSDNKNLQIKGSIELGITRNLRKLLDNYPDVQSVTLESDGGNIYEARGLAKVFRENSINTEVATSCTSACTTAFIGGKQRSMLDGAQLGFHQYRLDSNSLLILANPKEEQAKDKLLFIEAGVAKWFTDKMFQSASTEMWFPTLDELRTANVITPQN